MSVRPSLQAIADMPYSAGLVAVRQYYDPHWGEPQPEVDPDNPLRKFRVTVEFARTIEDVEVVTVEAADTDEACELAEEEIRAMYSEIDDLDFDVEEIEQ